MPAGIALVAASAAACGAGAGTADLPATMSGIIKQAKSEGEVDWSAPKPGPGPLDE
ncbi:hypothetical protein [Streptomyces sp. NPDC057696]|uniref:hypothetical protein n=1 Tax=unclassified Streptomyces TaxID=2593676 RepID=UPI0036C47113